MDIDSSLETIESIPTSVDKLGAKLIGNQEQPKPNFSDKKVKRILIKKIICFTLLNACTMTGLMIIAICLSDIGLGSIVATNGIFTVSDFLVNLLICFICDRIPRKKSLIILNMITLCFGICFVIISVTTDYNKTKGINMGLAFFMKGTLQINIILTILFGSKCRFELLCVF